MSAQRRLWSDWAIWVFAGRTCHFVGFVMRRLRLNLIQAYYPVCVSICGKNTTPKDIKRDKILIEEVIEILDLIDILIKPYYTDQTVETRQFFIRSEFKIYLLTWIKWILVTQLVPNFDVMLTFIIFYKIQIMRADTACTGGNRITVWRSANKTPLFDFQNSSLEQDLRWRFDDVTLKKKILFFSSKERRFFRAKGMCRAITKAYCKYVYNLCMSLLVLVLSV